ncbi:MAG TPA: hypothetical protein HA349_00085 [Methanotrichaceae archaeon]|nr:hypothetical protein [Methanotrichaceae archaeon]
MILATDISTVTVLPAESFIVLGYPVSSQIEVEDADAEPDPESEAVADANADVSDDSSNRNAKSAQNDFPFILIPLLSR